MKTFLDTNVLMDVILGRHPFLADAERLWFLSERGRIEGAVSALSFVNVYYVVRKARGPESAMTALKAMRDIFQIAECDEQILQQALDASFEVFEDAIQYFSALRVDAACLVSRNPRHFPKSSLPVFTPHDFFSVHSFD